jgi:hypothetical protein
LVSLCRGLQVWDDVRVVLGLFGRGGLFVEELEEAACDGEFFREFEGGGEGSEGGVGGGLLDEL